jgi:hypothetical protein
MLCHRLRQRRARYIGCRNLVSMQSHHFFGTLAHVGCVTVDLWCSPEPSTFDATPRNQPYQTRIHRTPATPLAGRTWALR